MQMMEKDEQKQLSQQPPKGKRLIRSFPYYFFLIFNGIVFYAIFAYLIGQYNVMSKHLPIIFGWEDYDDDKQTSLYSWTTSTTSLASAVASVFILFFRDSIGRRQFFLIALGCATIGTALALVANTAVLMTARVFHGFLIGIAIQIAPLYIREMSIPEYKQMFQLGLIMFLQFGVLNSQCLGFGLPDEETFDGSNQYWRFMLAFPLIYIIYEIVMLTFVYRYDTPAYVFNKHGEAEAKKILDRIFMPEKAEIELQVLKKVSQESKSQKEITTSQLWKQYKNQLLLAVIMTLAFHSAGYLPLKVYSNKIITLTESVDTATIYTTVGAVPNFITLIANLYLIEKVGSRNIQLISYYMASVFLIIMGIFGVCDHYEIFKYGYLATRFAYGLGTQYYFSYLAEILPIIGYSYIMILYHLISFCFFQYSLKVSEAIGYGYFFLGIGCACFVLTTVLIFFLRETRGLSKYQIIYMFEHGILKKNARQIDALIENKPTEMMTQQQEAIKSNQQQDEKAYVNNDLPDSYEKIEQKKKDILLKQETDHAQKMNGNGHCNGNQISPEQEELNGNQEVA